MEAAYHSAAQIPFAFFCVSCQTILPSLQVLGLLLQETSLGPPNQLRNQEARKQYFTNFSIDHLLLEGKCRSSSLHFPSSQPRGWENTCMNIPPSSYYPLRAGYIKPKVLTWPETLPLALSPLSLPAALVRHWLLLVLYTPGPLRMPSLRLRL